MQSNSYGKTKIGACCLLARRLVEAGAEFVMVDYGYDPGYGRTPKINKDAGRDHWGNAGSIFFAGGGVKGGQVIGSTDSRGAYPIAPERTPWNVAATLY